MSKSLRILGNLSAFIGILGFLYPLLGLQEVNLTIFQKIFISISAIICFAYFLIEIFTGPKKYKNAKQINEYMRKWINKPGLIVVFTRDMSWVDNLSIEDDLRSKARKRELIICHPKMTTLTTELKAIGAEVYTYEHIGYVPKSRFTFINYNSNSAKVAIGKKDDKHNHIISEFSPKDTIEYFLADDIINIIKAIS